MANFIANLVSVLFHPLIIPTYAFIVILVTYPYSFYQLNFKEKVFTAIVVFLNTFFLPLFAIALMKMLGFIKSFRMQTKEERVIPYIAIAVFYFSVFYYLNKFGELDPIFSILMLGATISVFLTFFFNLFYKISAHAVAAGNAICMIFFLALLSSYSLEIPLMITILLAGMIGTSRLYLKSHYAADVFSGYLVGFIGQLIAFKVI